MLESASKTKGISSIVDQEDSIFVCESVTVKISIFINALDDATIVVGFDWFRVCHWDLFTSVYTVGSKRRFTFCVNFSKEFVSTFVRTCGTLCFGFSFKFIFDVSSNSQTTFIIDESTFG
uniref:Uncharacterized protein n=1 Tax=Cacopsylla melanoneura TaxID=428564 RepID=A0A8D8PMJ8_9HEMI